MNLVYVSPSYSVVEFGGDEGGFEVIDRQRRVGVYMRGEMAERFRDSLTDVFANEPNEETIDDFLHEFDEMMAQPAQVH